MMRHLPRSTRPDPLFPTTTLFRSQPRCDINPRNTLAPYLVPKGEPGVRARVVISLAMLALAKVATVYVPVIYKQAVDLISGGPGFAASALIAIVVAYG